MENLSGGRGKRRGKSTLGRAVNVTKEEKETFDWLQFPNQPLQHEAGGRI